MGRTRRGECGATAGLSELDDARRKQAQRRWEQLRSYLQDGVPLTTLAATTGTPLRTLQRWLTRYRTAGLAGLARAERSSSAAATAAELVTVIEGLMLRRPGTLDRNSHPAGPRHRRGQRLAAFRRRLPCVPS